MEQQKTMDWLKKASTEATEAARRGDTTLSHRLGSNPATSYYYNNVHLLQSLSPEQWAEERPGEVEGATRLRLQYEALDNAGENEGRLTAVEGELTALRGQIGELLAELKKVNTTKPDAVTESKPKGKAAQKKTDDAEDSAESEA